MAVHRVSFLVDDETLGWAPDRVAELVTTNLLARARAQHNSVIREVRLDGSLSSEEKLEQLAPAVRGLMLALMAEANLSVEAMPAGTSVEMNMPFERVSA